MEVIKRVIPVLMFLVSLSAQADKLMGPFSGRLDNQTKLSASTLKIKATWRCITGVFEPRSCGTVSQDAALQAGGKFVVPAFSVPRLGTAERATVTFEIITAKAAFRITDDSETNFKGKLSNLIFFEVESALLDPKMKGGGDPTTWVAAVAPRGYLDADFVRQGGVVYYGQNFSDKIKSFPILIPSQYFIFTSVEDLKKGIALSYKVTSAVYDTGGYGVTSFVDFKYQGPAKHNAMAALSQFELNPTDLNTDISGTWAGSLVIDGKYTEKNGKSLSPARLDVVFSCLGGVLSGTVIVKYDDTYDRPNFAQRSLVSGNCGQGFATAKVVIPFKQYLGSEIVQREVHLSFNQTIANKTAQATLSVTDSNEVIGGFNLHRVSN